MTILVEKRNQLAEKRSVTKVKKKKPLFEEKGNSKFTHRGGL